MIFDNLCVKIYFWPFLSYLASIKGLCPFNPNDYFPITTQPPDTTDTTTTELIPTYQPTPPTTLLPCPDDPLVCLAGGERPIAYCPCIDPRLQNGLTTTSRTTTVSDENLQNLQFRPGLLPNQPSAVGSEIIIFSPLDNSKRYRKRKKRYVSKESK